MGAGVAKNQKEKASRESSSHKKSRDKVRCKQPPVPKPSDASAEADDMPCSQCSAQFTILKRKFICDECNLPHCSNCMPKDPGDTRGPITLSNKRRCPNCRILVSGNFTRHDLNKKFKVRDLKLFLERRDVNTSHCKEKNDLVELILQHSNSSSHWREQQEHDRHLSELQERSRRHQEDLERPPPAVHTQNVPMPSTTTQATNPPDPSTSNANSSTAPEGSSARPARSMEVSSSTESLNGPVSVHGTSAGSAAPPPAASVAGDNNPSGGDTLEERRQREMAHTERVLRDELKTEDAPKPAARKRIQLNDIATEEHIDELNNRQLKELLVLNFVDFKGCCERQELKDRVLMLWRDRKRTDAKGNVDDLPESEVCKICMDATIDCVFLYCGHVVTCTKCGQQLAECPVCRVNIVRVMRTFKA